MQTVYKGNYPPTIFVTPEAMEKINIFVDIASKEVGWLGSVRNTNIDYVYIIDDVFLLKQEVSSTETELDEIALAEFFDEHIDIVDKIRFWGHSHVNMAVNPSAQDTDQMDEFMNNGAGFFIMGIFNKAQDVRFDIYTPNFIFKEVGWQLWPNQELKESLIDEFNEKVKEKKIGNRHYPPQNWNRRSFQSDGFDEFDYGAGHNWNRGDRN